MTRLLGQQSKGDLQGAEEYYSRAILADPADGEIISQYASLVWELHRDRNKAESYFERAVQATPQDRLASISSLASIRIVFRNTVVLTLSNMLVYRDPYPLVIFSFLTNWFCFFAFSHVLAAYAKYLWETEGDEEDEHHSPGQNHIQTPVFLEAMTTANA